MKITTDIRFDRTNERTKWILWKFNAMEKRPTNHYIAQLQLLAFELFKNNCGLSAIEDNRNRFYTFWIGSAVVVFHLLEWGRNIPHSTSK